MLPRSRSTCPFWWEQSNSHFHDRARTADQVSIIVSDEDVRALYNRVRECLDHTGRGNPSSTDEFGHRTKYFDELFRGNDSGIWYCGVLEAANSTLGNLMEISLRVVSEVAQNEKEGSSSRSRADEAVQYVRAELGDADLHSGLLTLYQSFQENLTNHTTVEGQLITRVFHRLRCVLLLLAILEQPSIQIGVSTPKAQYLGKVVISFCQKQAIRRDGPIEDYYLISWHNFSHLLLGGICLTIEDYPESKALYRIVLTLSVCMGHIGVGVHREGAMGQEFGIVLA